MIPEVTKMKDKTIKGLAEESKGFIWYATRYGLITLFIFGTWFIVLVKIYDSHSYSSPNRIFTTLAILAVILLSNIVFNIILSAKHLRKYENNQRVPIISLVISILTLILLLMAVFVRLFFAM